MIRSLNLLFLCSFCCLIAIPVAAQEACSDEDAAALELCISDSKVACLALYPSCERPALTEQEAIDAIEAACSCGDAKNYGKYRSCVAKVSKGLRALGVLSLDVKNAIKESNFSCRAEIKDRRKQDKANKSKGQSKGKKNAPADEQSLE